MTAPTGGILALATAIAFVGGLAWIVIQVFG
jgi:hypothetical protein